MPDPVARQPRLPAGPDDDLKQALAAVWDAGAAGYDVSPGHGVRDPNVARAWQAAIAEVLLAARSDTRECLRVLDVGTGTGVVALLVAGLGHRVTGIDLSSGMIAQAVSRAEALGLAVDFRLGDAEEPAFPPASFDVVISRHVLWTLPHPATAVAGWTTLVAPGGSVVVFDVYHPALSIPRRALGVLAEWVDTEGRRSSGGHHYTRQQRQSLPLAVQRDPAAGEGVLRGAGLVSVGMRRLPDIDAAERRALGWLTRLGRPYRHYVASGVRPPQ
jgi:ubiquinone/menaquinone biosynthesis C-methylase UbiE